MQAKTERKITWRDVADWAIFFACVQLGTIVCALLIDMGGPVYSLVKFVVSVVTLVPVYVVGRLVKRGRIFLR